MTSSRWRRGLRWLPSAALAAILITIANSGPAPATARSVASVAPFPPGTTMRAIQDRRQLVVGIKFDSPPFGFKDPRTEEVVGFDADAARAVGDALGVPVRFVETTSSNRIPFLRNGRVDIVFATMTITPERAKIVQFSDPYYIAPGRILVKRGNAEIREVPDLNGKRVCLTIGSTFGASVRKLAPRAQLREVDGYSACAQLLDVNAVDAVVSEDVSLIGMILRNSDFELVGPSFTEEPFGAAMARDHPEWQTFVNAVLASMKSDGSWKNSYDKWIGSQTHSAATPPSRTLSELLAKEGSP